MNTHKKIRLGHAFQDGGEFKDYLLALLPSAGGEHEITTTSLVRWEKKQKIFDRIISIQSCRLVKTFIFPALRDRLMASIISALKPPPLNSEPIVVTKNHILRNKNDGRVLAPCDVAAVDPSEPTPASV